MTDRALARLRLQPPAVRCSEADFASFVEGALDLGGWLWWHDTDSRRSKAGLFDYIACHPNRGLLVAELKTERGRLRPEQERWQRVARAAIGGGCDAMLGATAGRRVFVRVWRPSMWRDVLDVTGVSLLVERIA